MKTFWHRLFGLFGRKKPSVDIYQLSPYMPAYHPSLVIRRRKAIAGWAKLSAVSVVLVFAAVGYAGWRSLSDIHQIYALQKSSAPVQELPVQAKLATDANGKTNILLLGIAGVPNKAPDLTDAMTILQVDSVTKKTSYLVLPRKLMVHSTSPYYGEWQALNTVYSAGKYSHLGKADAASTDPLAKQAGFAALDKSVQNITGLDIHYNVVVDYAALAQAIDSVGGIPITASTRIVDAPLMKPYGKNRTVAVRGEQVMNGRQAVVYARTFAGSDEKVREAGRLERQLQIVKAYVKKVSSAGMLKNPAGLQDVFTSFGASFYTDMKPAESVLATTMLLGSNMRYAGFLAYEASDPSTPFVQSKDTKNDLLEPKAGKDTYAEVQNYIAARLNGSVPMGKEFAILE